MSARQRRYALSRRGGANLIQISPPSSRITPRRYLSAVRGAIARDAAVCRRVPRGYVDAARRAAQSRAVARKRALRERRVSECAPAICAQQTRAALYARRRDISVCRAARRRAVLCLRVAAPDVCRAFRINALDGGALRAARAARPSAYGRSKSDERATTSRLCRLKHARHGASLPPFHATSAPRRVYAVCARSSADAAALLPHRATMPPNARDALMPRQMTPRRAPGSAPVHACVMQADGRKIGRAEESEIAEPAPPYARLSP